MNEKHDVSPESSTNLPSDFFSLYDLKKIWHPSWCQGNRQKKNYFEGWYFKLLSAEGRYKYAFIPGISLGNNPHSFVQLINGQDGSTEYYRFEVSEFLYSKKGFDIKVGPNRFSEKHLEVYLEGNRGIISGSVEFGELLRYPVTWLNPGIMGWYRFVPFMECYHGVVSMGHGLTGGISFRKQTVLFDMGKGYIEKDWGKSMPKAWIWMQSNHFGQEEQASFMLSIARIPWMGSSFTGFLGYMHTGIRLYRFATYTGARIRDLKCTSDVVDIILEDSNFILSISGIKGKRGELLAPVDGSMSRTIHESMDGKIEIRLTNRKGEVLFEGNAVHAGLELVGDSSLLK